MRPQKNSQLYTNVFPQIEARASISYPGLLVEQIQDKNNKNQTNWDSNPSSEGSKIITLTKRTISATTDPASTTGVLFGGSFYSRKYGTQLMHHQSYQLLEHWLLYLLSS